MRDAAGLVAGMVLLETREEMAADNDQVARIGGMLALGATVGGAIVGGIQKAFGAGRYSREREIVVAQLQDDFQKHAAEDRASFADLSTTLQRMETTLAETRTDVRWLREGRGHPAPSED